MQLRYKCNGLSQFKYMFILFGFLPFWNCGGTTSGVSVNVIQFSPNSVKAKSGVCASEALLVSNLSGSATIVSLSATFRDASQKTATFKMDEKELEDAIGTLTIPSHSALKLPLTFDIGKKGISFPATGDILVIGFGNGDTVEFTGTFRCEK